MVLVADGEEAQLASNPSIDLRAVLGEIEPGACNEIGNNARGEYLAGLRPRADALRAMNCKPRDAGVAELDLAGVHTAGDVKAERCPRFGQRQRAANRPRRPIEPRAELLRCSIPIGCPP